MLHWDAKFKKPLIQEGSKVFLQENIGSQEDELTFENIFVLQSMVAIF